MRDEKPTLMRRVGIDMVDMGRDQGSCQSLFVPAAMPFAANPTDAVEMASRSERLQDHVLSPFAVELQQIDFLDIKLGETCPELLGRHATLQCEQCCAPEVRSYPGAVQLRRFVLEQLGQLPQVGDVVTYGDLRIEVADMDGFRVDRLLVSVEREAEHREAGA
jgi:hypothetical protein